MTPVQDVTGKKYGRLTAIKKYKVTTYRQHIWKFRCDCGKIIAAHLTNVRSGHTKSCGCLRSELSSIRLIKHGMAKTSEYNIWCRMRRRCNRKLPSIYSKDYYKGITVCKRWEKFENFIKDMGRIPPGKYSIDRIDNKKGYFKANCRWANHTEQMRNKRCSIFITYKKVTKHLSEWAEALGIPNKVLWERLYRNRWSIEKALTHLTKI